MSLDAGTAKTDWASSDAVDTEDMNRIEGNIQSLEDSKVENVSGVVDLRDQTDPSTDADVSVKFASDASLLWDESEDEFIFSKPLRASGYAVADGGEQVTLEYRPEDSGVSETLAVPAGVWIIRRLVLNPGEPSEASIMLQTFSTINYPAYSVPNFTAWSGYLIVSDGVNVTLTYSSSQPNLDLVLQRA